jgi:predicted dehydrogenase
MKLNMIGCRGHWGYVFESIGELPDLELTAVSPGCKDSMEKVLAKAAEFKFSPEFYADYLEMLDSEKPDIVCIDGPFDKHAEFSIECLRRNIHVFCEKTLALTLEDIDSLQAAYEHSSAKIFSMNSLRYEAPFQTALSMVKSGQIGKVKIISARKSYKLGVRPEYYKQRKTYGGTIPWVGSHAIDLIMAFSGSLEFKSIFAADNREDNFDNGELEIAAECQFVMRNGVLAQASIDYLRPASAGTHGDDQIRVAGTAGVIEVRHGKIFLIDRNGEQEIAPHAERNIFSDIVLDCQGRRCAILSPEESIELTRASLLAQKSADESIPVYK